MKVVKSILQALISLFKVIMPKSRWGNIVWGILGVLLAQWDSFETIIKAILAVFGVS